MMKFTKGAIGNLINKYKSVLKKCLFYLLLIYSINILTFNNTLAETTYNPFRSLASCYNNQHFLYSEQFNNINKTYTKDGITKDTKFILTIDDQDSKKNNVIIEGIDYTFDNAWGIFSNVYEEKPSGYTKGISNITITGSFTNNKKISSLNIGFNKNDNQTITIIASFQFNETNTNGGAIRVEYPDRDTTRFGNIYIQNSTFNNNTANLTSDNGGSSGGALNLNPVNIKIYNSTFTNNTATGSYGGAINARGCILELKESTFDGNKLKRSSYNNQCGGGALSTYEHNADTSETYINNCTFKNNKVILGVGGAIYQRSNKYLSKIFLLGNNIFENNYDNKNSEEDKGQLNDIYNLSGYIEIQSGTTNLKSGYRQNKTVDLTTTIDEISYKSGQTLVQSGATFNIQNDDENATFDLNGGNFDISGNSSIDILNSAATTVITIYSTGKLSINTSISGDGKIINNGTLVLGKKTDDDKASTYSTGSIGILSGNGKLEITANISKQEESNKAKENSYITVNSVEGTPSLDLTKIYISDISNMPSEGKYPEYITYINGSGKDNINYTINNDISGVYSISNLGNIYNFTLGEEKGTLDLEIIADSLSFPDFIQGKTSVQTFIISQNLTVNKDIGKTFSDDRRGNVKNLYVIFDGEYTLTGNTDKEGIIVDTEYILNIEGRDTETKGKITGFDTAVSVLDGGTLNLSNMTFTGNTTDIVNDGTVNFSESNTINSITGNGSAKNTGTLDISADGLGNVIENAGIINLTSGTLLKAVNGTGTTNVQETVTGEADILNKLSVSSKNNASLTINAKHLKNTVDNRGTLNLTGGTLSNDVSGAGQTNVTSNLTNTASVTNAVDVSSGVTLTNKESGKIIGVLTNAGTVISDASNLQGKVENTGNLELTAGTMRFDVSGTGTTTVSGVVSNEGTNTNSLTISAKGGLVNSGILSGTVTNEGTLASQISDITGKVVNNGTFLMSGNLNKDISGSGTTLLASAIAIVEGNTSIAGTLNMNNATVEMRDKGENLNILTVGSLSGTGSLSIDADMSNGSSDQIKINGGGSNKATVKVASINVTKDGKSGTQKDFISYLSGALSGIECQLGQDGTLTTVTEGYKYTFSLGSTGKLNVITEDGIVADLSSFISDVGTMSGVSTYSFGKDITVSEALSKTSSSSGRGGELTMALNGYALQSGNSCDGFVVGKGYTVNLNGPSGIVSGFGTAIEIEQGATLNVSGVTFKDNKTDIQNKGDLNLTGTNTVSVVNNGTLQLAGDNTLVKLSGSGTAINTGKVTVGASGLGNPLVNNNELVLGAGTLSKEVSGAGSVEITGDVKTAADVSLTAFSTKLSSGTLTVKGIAKLGIVDFSGAGALTLSGDSTVVADMKNFLDETYSSAVGSRVTGTSGSLNLNLGGASYTATQYKTAKEALFGGSDEKAGLNFLNGTLKLEDGDNLAVGGNIEKKTSGQKTITITEVPVVVEDKRTTTNLDNIDMPSLIDAYVQVVDETTEMDSKTDQKEAVTTINIEGTSFKAKGLTIGKDSEKEEVSLNIRKGSNIAFTGGDKGDLSVIVTDGQQACIVTDITVEAESRLDFGVDGNKADQKGTIRKVTVNGTHGVAGNGAEKTIFSYGSLVVESLKGSEAKVDVKDADIRIDTMKVSSDDNEKASSFVSVEKGSSVTSQSISVAGSGTTLEIKDGSTVTADALEVSEGGAVNVISSILKVKEGQVRIGADGTLFLDPVHFDAGALADDNTLSGGLYVGDGTVALIGADDSFRSTLYNRLLKEDSPVSVTGTLEDYTVGTGQTVLGLGSPMKMTTGAKLIVDSTVKSDGSISGDTLPSGTSYVYFGKDSLLAVDGNKVTKDAAISTASGTKAKIAENAKLYIANAVSGNSYYILAVDSIEGSAGWTGDKLIVDTDLLGAYFHYSGTDQGWVSIETKPEEDIYPGLDGELVKLLKNMADGGLIDTESDTMGIRFLSRATASEASGKYMAGDKKGAVKTIESAARIAMAGAVPQMTIMASETLSEAMGNRMNIANGYNTTILEQEFKTGLALWITPLWKNQSGWGMEAFKQNYGFNANIGGIALGADYSFSETLRAGLAFNIGGGYAKSSGDLASTENHMNFWGIGIYGGYNNGTLSVMGDASYTSTYNKLEQDLDARMQMKNLKADVRASVWSLGIRGDYKFKLESLDITPHVGVRFESIASQEYDIKGGGTIAKSDGIQQSFWSIPVGVTFGKDFKTASGWSVTPSVDFTVTPRFGDLKAYESIRFTGVPGDAGLHTQTRDYVSYKGTAGIGAKYKNIGLNLNYSYEAGSCTSGHGVNASFRWEF